MTEDKYTYDQKRILLNGYIADRYNHINAVKLSNLPEDSKQNSIKSYDLQVDVVLEIIRNLHSYHGE